MMTKGIIIYNSLLLTDKFKEHITLFKEAAKKLNSSLYTVSNSEIVFSNTGNNLELIFSSINLSDIDYIIFWDKDIPLGKMLINYFKDTRVKIYNNPISIDISDDKYKTYMEILNWNLLNPDKKINIPDTIIFPMTYFNESKIDINYLEIIEKRIKYPMVIKECFGSFGKEVYLANNREDVYKILSNIKGRPFIFQEYISKSMGTDIRLQVVGNEVVAAMKRENKDGDFRANLSNGGISTSYKFSKEEETLAINAVKALNLDFAGVDLLFSNGSASPASVICEVNSNAHFKNISNATGVDVAYKIMSYIIKNL